MLKQIFERHRKAVIALLSLAVITITATSVYVFYSSTAADGEEAMPEVLAAVAKQVEPPEDLNTLTVLLLGYGGPGHQGGYLSDVIQLVHLDFEKETIAMISIPRDLWVQLPNNSAAKINQAFTMGKDKSDLVGSGGQVAKEMATIVTGLSVDYFIAVDFVGFQRAIGQNLKGIEVDVPEALNDPWYPIKGEELNTCGLSAEEVASLTAQYSGFELERKFPCRYETVNIPTGKVSMQGGEALKYVRSRHGSAGGDFSRSQRQHALLKGLRDRLFSLDALADAPAFFKIVSSNVTTDLSLDAVEYIAPALTMLDKPAMEGIVISTDNVLSSSRSSSGQSILIPKAGHNNWSQIHSYIQGELNK